MAIANEEPLRDSDTIRVYHGFNDHENAIIAAKFGLSGKEKAKRVYSYESNNNPYGLFVTLNFDKAKDFAFPRGGHKVVFELHVKVSDLEAPVWPSGGYTVQGQMAQYWKDEKDRYEKGTLAARERASKDELEFISQSDRPELAYTHTYMENQALFVGDLDPNMIHAIWYGNSGKHSHNPDRLVKMNRKQFLNQFETHEPGRDYNDRITNKGYEYHDKKGRVFKPSDDFDIDKLKAGVMKKGWARDEEELESIINDVIKKDSHYADKVMWAKQIKQAKEQGFFDY